MRRSAASSDARNGALDGLRGLAALVVVLHHLLLATIPRLANAYQGLPAPDGLAHLVTSTPLHVIWDGPAAVVIFFVLSGYVLSIASSSGKPFRAAAYYPARMVRLYVPVWGALVFAAITRLVVHREQVPGATWWLNGHVLPVTGARVWDNVSLISLPDPALNSVLWSLRWEIAFSLLLPFFLVVAHRARPLHVPLAALCLLGVSLAGSHLSLQFLPVFGLGVLLAFNRPAIDRLARALEGRWWAKLALGVVALCLLEATWWAGVGIDVAYAAAALGGAMVVVLVLVSGTAQRVLGSRPGVFVGRRSYSLYLVHEPIVVAVALGLGTGESLPKVAVIALPLVAVCTVLFYAAVEKPSHTAARQAGALGQRVAAALARRGDGGPASARS